MKCTYTMGGEEGPGRNDLLGLNEDQMIVIRIALRAFVKDNEKYALDSLQKHTASAKGILDRISHPEFIVMADNEGR